LVKKQNLGKKTKIFHPNFVFWPYLLNQYQYYFIWEQLWTNIKSCTTENKPHKSSVYFVPM